MNYIIISEKDFETLANCITTLCGIYGNIAAAKENEETRRKNILHFVKGGNACDNKDKRSAGVNE